MKRAPVQNGHAYCSYPATEQGENHNGTNMPTHTGHQAAASKGTPMRRILSPKEIDILLGPGPDEDALRKPAGKRSGRAPQPANPRPQGEDPS